MHNSSPKITFLLMITLIMLVPITNTNLFSNPAAMAQDYDNYAADNSYSKYPTDDKKYECRTGLFEGFFVSSVEFCQFNKFDDKYRKDIRENRTETQGLPGAEGLSGPPGIQGPQGLPGLQGIPGVNGTNGINGTNGVNGTNIQPCVACLLDALVKLDSGALLVNVTANLERGQLGPSGDVSVTLPLVIDVDLALLLQQQLAITLGLDANASIFEICAAIDAEQESLDIAAIIDGLELDLDPIVTAQISQLVNQIAIAISNITGEPIDQALIDEILASIDIDDIVAQITANVQVSLEILEACLGQVPPPLTAETLTVIKNVDCLADAQTCEQNSIQPSNFTIVIDGNNPSQNNFPGSSDPGTNVELEPGTYNVTEQGLDVVTPQLCTNMGFEAGMVVDSTSGLFICTDFSEDCEGEIAIGSPQTCRIDNVLVTTPPPIAGNNVCTVWQDNAPGKDEIFFSGSPDDGETFTTPLNISRNAENSKESQVKCDGNNVYAAWEDETTTFANNDIFFSFSHNNGQTFSTKNISNNTGDSQDAQIAVKGNNVYLVWEDTTRDVFDISFAMSTDGGLTFNTKTISNNPAGGFGSEDPQISLQGNNIYVVWKQDGLSDNFPDIFITRSTDGGQTFSEPDNISNTDGGSQVPQISSEGDNVYVVWEERAPRNEDILFSYSHDSGQTFSAPFNISNSSTIRSFNPQISSQGNNTYVVWEEFTDDDDIFFAMSTNGGQSISTKNLSNNTGDSHEAQISSEGNNVYVVWQDDTPRNDDIFFAMSTNGGQTFSTKNISNNAGNSWFPQISSIENNVYVVWQDDTDTPSGSFNIFFTFSHDGGETFSEPENLSESTGDSLFPQISSNTQTQQQSTNEIITTAGNNNHDDTINDITTKGLTSINSIIEQEEKQKLAEEKLQQSNVMSPPSFQEYNTSR
jgi:hypothetical protein